MGLDHSCLTINVERIEKFKNRTLNKMFAKYADDPKPLFLVNKSKGILYIDRKEVARVARDVMYPSFSINNALGIGGDHFYHPAQTMEAIERFETVCPAFAAWLIFNMEPLFATLTPK